MKPAPGTEVEWVLQLHGVGNASAGRTGSAMAARTRACHGATIDCGGEGLTFPTRYGDMPRAVFITHVLDHVAGMERPVRGQLFRSCAARRCACTCRRRWYRCCISALPAIRRTGRGRELRRVPAGAGGRGLLARRSAAGGLPGHGITGPRRRSACACAAAWSGPAIRGPFQASSGHG